MLSIFQIYLNGVNNIPTDSGVIAVVLFVQVAIGLAQKYKTIDAL